MAVQAEIDFTYTLTDKLFRLSVGNQGDFSGAKYDGDFSLTLEQAQERKHAFVVEQLRVPVGGRVLDIGCGWGAMLAYMRQRGIRGTGVTLSTGQFRACRRYGLDVHLLDCRTITPSTFGGFDGVSSLGAFEHFCSVEQFRAGHQEWVYSDLFRTVAALIPPGGRFFRAKRGWAMAGAAGLGSARLLEVGAARHPACRAGTAWRQRFIADQTEGEIEKKSGAVTTLEAKESELRVQQRYMLQLQSALGPMALPPYLQEFLAQVWSQAERLAIASRARTPPLLI
jgi:2-polyprenyl-3-methyl-5-hydroxy-6-metoxy-1,4-benzoquinol methylase